MLSRVPTGENVPDFIEEFSAVDSTSCVAKLAIPRQLSGTFCMRDDNTSKRVNAQDLSVADTVVADFQSLSIDKSSVVRDEEEKYNMKADYRAELSLQRNDKREDALNVDNSLESSPMRAEGKAMSKVDDSSNTMSPDIACSSLHQKRNRKNKLNQENKKKRPARSCRKASSKNALLDVSSLQFTRRRRSLCKQARATAWGLLGNIATVLEQNDTVNISPQKANKSRRLKGVDGTGKGEKNKRVQNSRKLKGKKFTSTGPITLKVKFGKEMACTMNVRTVIDDNKDEDSKNEKSSPEVSIDVQELLKKEASRSMSFQSFDGNLEKASNRHLEIEDITENADGSTYDGLCESPFQGEVDKAIATIDTRISDSGTSPDSEVINLTPYAQINEKDPESLNHALSSADMYLASEDIPSLTLQCKTLDRRKRDKKHCHTGNFGLNGEVPTPANAADVQEFSKLGQKEKVGDASYHSDASTSTTETASHNALNVEGFPKEFPPCSKVSDLAISRVASRVESETATIISPRLGIELESLESNISGKMLPCIKGQKLAKSSGARKETKNSFKTPNSSRKEKISKKKGNQDKSSGKQKNKNKGDFAQILHDVEKNHQETGMDNFR